MKIQNKNGFIDLTMVYGSSDVKAVEKNLALSPQAPGSEGISANGQVSEDRATQIAEARLQGDTRAAELKAELDQKSGTEKPKENGIIAILIG